MGEKLKFIPVFLKFEFGNFYVDDRETHQVLALHNQIGVTVTEHELLIHTY